ncbi:MAG: ATP-binding protein [Oscillospiraceae bacterium]|nr:ATP-binding protein [Oscillospiraceae bacterium]
MDNIETANLLQDELQQANKEIRALKRTNLALQQTIKAIENNYTFQKKIFESAKIQKERQALYLSLVLEFTPNIVFVIDKNFKMMNISKNSLRKYGVIIDSTSERELIDVFAPFVPEEQIERVGDAIRAVLQDGKVREYDKTPIVFAERFYIFDISVVPLRDTSGEILGIMVTMHDITDLQHAIDDAEAASRAKSNFLAKVSHEIRTPMNAILGLSELALREELTKVSRDHVVGIKHAGNHLITIINDILDFSKIESGKMEVIPVDYELSSLVDYATGIIRMRVIDLPILFTANVDPDIPEHLIGDEMRLKQMMLNLLSNACKYSKGGYVKLDVSFETIDERTIMLNISVADSGIGIKKENIGKLFADFVQIGETIDNKGVEGTGLGLAITHGFAVAMGGKVTVKSKYGVGSIFTISVPQKIDKTKENELFASVEDKKKNVSALIYETREIYTDSLIKSISGLGINFNLAKTQSDFIEKTERKKYDFTFVPSFFHDSARKALRKLGREDATLILVAEFGEHIIETVTTKTLTMPAHTGDVADIFNDSVKSGKNKNKRGFSFIAPSARVLVVDDINTNLMVAQGLMATYKMTIDLCKSGKESIEMVKNNNYDIIFMDHMMPEMDGIEATSNIRNLKVDGNGYKGRKSDYYKKLPFVALTANAVSGMKEMFLQNGFDDFLAKPIDVNILNTIIERWLPKDKIENISVTKSVGIIQPSFRIEGVDVENGISMTGGDPNNYLKTLGIFRDDGLEKIDIIRRCIENDDLPLYATHIHALKSASASIGAAKLSNLARSLEVAAKNNDGEFVAKNTERFLEELTMLLESIKLAVQSVKVVKKESDGKVDTKLIAEKAAQLRQAIDVFDMETVETVMNQLRDNSNEEMDKILEEISNNILICEYDKVSELTMLLTVDN